MAEEFKILIASDNHLGFLENDPIRGADSFRTFDEILDIANRAEVDMVLLGGDLFHDSNPSRECIHRTMQILRNRCVGDRPISINVLSSPGAPVRRVGGDDDSNGGNNNNNGDEEYSYGNDDPTEQRKRRGSEKYVNTCTPKNPNFVDPNYNISLPVYSIHGNHDDPTGKGAGLSALDLLADANFINYFGKTQRVDDITVVPILLKKGNIGVALYGLGSIRNERLYRTLENEKLSLMIPGDEDEDGNGWFKIFVVHQNRANRSPKSYFKEEKIPKEIDFVLWGHEHDCRINPVRLFDTTFLSQPGSSIAITLDEKENIKKHVGILRISSNKEFKFETIELKTVRPFIYDTLNLSLVLKEGEKDKEKVESVIRSKVDSMIEEGIATGSKIQPPLIRLKVDYTGFPKLVPQTFGKQYINRVANHASILALTSRQAKTQKSISVLMATGADVKDAADDSNHPQDGDSDDPLLANVNDPLERSILGFLSGSIANRTSKLLVKNEFFDVVSANNGEIKNKKGEESNKFIRIITKCNNEFASVADDDEKLTKCVETIVQENESAYTSRRRSEKRSGVSGNRQIDSFYDDEASISAPPPAKRSNTGAGALRSFGRQNSGSNGSLDPFPIKHDDEDSAGDEHNRGGEEDDDLVLIEPQQVQKKVPSKKATTGSKKQRLQLPFKKAPTLPSSSLPQSSQNEPKPSPFGQWAIRK